MIWQPSTALGLPAPAPAAFVKALQEVLSRLEKVVLPEKRLHAALVSGGMPCTVAELRGRIDDFVSELTKGKDPAKVRLVLEE